MQSFSRSLKISRLNGSILTKELGQIEAGENKRHDGRGARACPGLRADLIIGVNYWAQSLISDLSLLYCFCNSLSLPILD